MISTTFLAAVLAAVAANPAVAAPALPTASLTTQTLPTGTGVPTSDISAVSLPTVTLPTGTLPTRDCTVTVTNTHSTCVGLTSTVYPSTVTSTARMPCGACVGVEMVPPLLMCPAVMPYTTITASTASTSWTTACAITDLGTLPGHIVTSLPTEGTDKMKLKRVA